MSTDFKFTPTEDHNLHLAHQLAREMERIREEIDDILSPIMSRLAEHIESAPLEDLMRLEDCLPKFPASFQRIELRTLILMRRGR